MIKRPMQGFEIVREGATTVLVRLEWKPFLLRDLLENFRDVESSRRKVYSGSGRAEHFSYAPDGARDRVFVRRVARGGLVSMFGNLHLGIDRPLREIAASQAAARAGIPVPEIIAARATRAFGPFHRLTVVVREIPDAQNLLTLGPALRPAEKRQVIGKLANILRRMNEAGIYHADLTVRNILVDRAREVYIIDLDKAHVPGSRDGRSDVGSLGRLNRSVEKMLGATGCVTRADKLRFLREYRQGGEGLVQFAQRCSSGLWFHRLWWALSGQI